MPASERKFLLCTGQCVEYGHLHEYPASHIVGELRYLQDEERKVTALAVYLVPVEANHVPPIRPEIMLDVIGDARNIRCRFEGCEHRQRWEIGRAGALSLMTRMGLVEEYLMKEKDVK